MSDTSIEWTDVSWNPVTGCSKVSPGCAHCYAETVAARFWPTQYPQVAGGSFVRPREFTDVMCHEDRLDQPLHWKKPRKVFVNSMSDLFHEDVPDAFIDKVFAVMALAPQHTFQVLTKRAERMLAYMTQPNREGSTRESAVNGAIWSMLGTRRGSKIRHGGNWGCQWPLPNVWLGVSVENQRFADERLPLLLQTPAAVRFISAEPLLGRVDLTNYLWTIPGARLNRLHWIIVGGESGHGARPFDVEWARWLVAQGRSSGVPVFVKQLGAVPVDTSTGSPRRSFAGSKGQNVEAWPEDLRVREMPQEARCGRY